MEIAVTVKNKIASLVYPASIVCGNSDYTVKFSFDDEWAAYETKTARFRWNCEYKDVIFLGNKCPIPVINDASVAEVGVYAGDLHTTTPAQIRCIRSILSGGGSPADPPDDVYNQILERLNSLEGVTPATAEKLGVIKVGNNLEITKDGVLSVTTTNDAEEDNTRPITSAGVYTQVGNIEILLAAL